MTTPEEKQKRLNDAAKRLINRVEGPACLRFSDQFGIRLKDHLAWCEFYVAVKDLERTEPVLCPTCKPRRNPGDGQKDCV